jgi:3-mercaptopyruvate sulfurtransferase SseA
VKLNRHSIFPLLMMVAGVFLILGAIAWFISFAPVDASRVSSSAASGSLPVIPFPEVKRISLADAKAAYDLGNAVFIDVRGEPYYSQGHIPGALSISEDELEARLGELDSSAWIITYCT